MRIGWAIEIECDACGHKEQLMPPSGGHVGSDTPPGWMKEYILSDVFSRQYRDICPICMLKPVSEVCIMITNRAKEMNR